MVIGELPPVLREVHSTYHYLPGRGNLFRITCNGWIFLRKFVSHHAAATGKALNSKEYENAGRNRVGTRFALRTTARGGGNGQTRRERSRALCPTRGVPVRVRPPDTTRGMAISVTERRSARRFEVQLPLIVRWTSGSAVGEAVTDSKDVSSRGLYFLSPKDIKHGSPVEIVMTLPHEITRVGPVKVRCLGRIQRIELRPGRKVGVAAAIERYEFLRGDKTAT